MKDPWLVSHRLDQQGLCAPVHSRSKPAETAADVVRRLGAVQAQDYHGALWSLGLRTGLTEAQVIAAVERREIIRTWPQRGTLHYVAPEDAGWMTALSARRLLAGIGRRHEHLGLNPATLERSKELFGKALRGGKTLTRPRMMELLEADGISTQGGRGYHMLWYAAQTGQTYIGPMQAKQQTFGLLADLPVKQRKLERDAAAAELALRYFTSHGPATLQDFMWWSGMTSAEAKAGLAANASRLVSEKVDGQDYWLAPDGGARPAVPKALLLPGFDEYILGYKDRTAQMKPEYLARIVPGSNGMFMSSAVVNGRVAGSWKRTLRKASVVIQVESFEAWKPMARKAITQAAEAYGRFVGLPAEVSFS